MQTLQTPGATEELLRRLNRLEPQSRRQWGTLSAHEMLCHLADSFKAPLGERPFVPASTWFTRNVIRRVALHTRLPWPQGLPTRPEFNPRLDGTRPGSFDADRDAAAAILKRFTAPDARYGSHPILGAMTRDEWLTWGYRHVDHHLRQFGL